MLAIINEFRCEYAVGNFLKTGNLRQAIGVKEFKLRRIDKEVRFKFMKLNKRNEPSIRDVSRPSGLERLHTLVGIMP